MTPEGRAAAKREGGRAYREANPEKVRASGRNYREANRNKLQEKYRAYYEANRERILDERRAAYQVNRADPLYKLSQRENKRRGPKGDGSAVTRRGSWSPEDIAVLIRKDLNLVQKSAILNRRYYACQTRLRQLRKKGLI